MSKPAIVRRLAQILPPLLGIAIFGASVWAIHQELQQYRLEDILHRLAAIPSRYLWLAVGLTGLNYLAISGYDTLAMRYIKHPLAYGKSAFAAVVSTAVSNSVGFALLSGSAIRYRLYPPWGLSIAQVAQVIAFSSVTFWLGLFSTAGAIFVLQPVAIPDLLRLPVRSTRSIGVVFVVITAVYLLWNLIHRRPARVGKWTLPQVPLGLALAQIVVASIDWALAVTVLYVLLQPSTLPYSSFFGIYLLSQFAGVVSNVPGGLGVFETVMLLLLPRLVRDGGAAPAVSPADLLGALLAYRSIYYLLPLVVAAVSLGIYELHKRFR